MQTVILQRTIPHYRIPLFERLHRELGWLVATDSERGAHGLHEIEATPPWLHRFPFKRHSRHQYRACVPVDAIVDALRPDAFVAEFSPQMSSSWRLSRDALLGNRQRKLAYWSQGWNVERGFRKPQDFLLQVLRLALMAPAHAHLCYSADGAAFLRRWLPGHAPVFVAQNTVDLAGYPGRGIDNAPTRADQASLLFVGRLTPDKRVPLLISAFASARRRVPGLRLRIIGDGPDRAAVHAAAAEQGAAVEVLGPLYDDAQLAPHFQSASLFVYAGSIGLAANHALAYGVPIVVYDAPKGAPHHPEHSYVVDGVTGYRVASDTVDALAAQLVSLADRPAPAKTELRPKIEQYVSENLTIDTMISGFHLLDQYLRA